MVERIRWDTVSYLPFYYIFFEINFQFLFLTIFNLQAKILAIKDILSNMDCVLTCVNLYLLHSINNTDNKVNILIALISKRKVGKKCK